MRDIPTEAAYLREALRLGVCTVRNVVSWSDSIVSESSSPPDTFIELSSMQKAHPLDVLGVLNTLSSHIPAIDVLPVVLGLSHKRLKIEPAYAPELANALYSVFAESGYKVPMELTDIGWFGDAFFLGKQGTYGSVESAYADLLTFTEGFTERANQALQQTHLRLAAEL